MAADPDHAEKVLRMKCVAHNQSAKPAWPGEHGHKAKHDNERFLTEFLTL